MCAYFPYPMKIWLNGHEWAKRQAVKAGVGFTELSNGFATCADPAALQAICDRLGPGAIRVFAERWWSILPLPLAADRPPAPPPVRKAFRTIDIHITETIDRARLLPKAA